MVRKFFWVLVLVLAAMMFAACGKSEFGVTDNTGKRMTISAEKAEKDGFFMVGTLDVADGEEIVITSALKKGRIKVEIVTRPEEQSMDKFPEIDGDAVLTAEVGSGEGATGTVPAGGYMLRATCLEKATGTVQVEVKPKGTK